MPHQEIDLHHLPVIDRGESDVYRYDDTHVLKRYDGLPFETVCLYQTITDQVGQIMDGTPLTFALEKPPLTARYTCRVVPIDSVGIDQHGTPYAISEYIPGPQLFSLIQKGSVSTPDRLSDPLQTIATYDKMIFYRTLDIVNRDLRAAMRNPNVLLTPINMKIAGDTCSITDVTSDVRLISPPSPFSQFQRSLFVE
jgi:serine/threonine protein kinase